MVENDGTHDEWETPDELFNELNKEFNFDFDLACKSNNCKTDLGAWYDKGIDGLTFDFDPNKEYSIWCNPPYNRVDKPKFIKRCFEISKLNNINVVVMLIPAKTSTSDFHDIILPNAEIRWLRGRPKFKGINSDGDYVTAKSGRNDCMIVIFKQK